MIVNINRSPLHSITLLCRVEFFERNMSAMIAGVTVFNDIANKARAKLDQSLHQAVHCSRLYNYTMTSTN